jgi:hypothetical protein
MQGKHVIKYQHFDYCGRLKILFSFGMVIGLSGNVEINFVLQSMIMKKTIKKILNHSLRKLKEHKQRIARYKFSMYKEDFVITAQEEKEGGFFGTIDPSFRLQLVK